MIIELPKGGQTLATIRQTNETPLLQLDFEQLKDLFMQYGAVLFRGFKVNIDVFSAFTDHFCNRYVKNERRTRTKISRDGRVQTVTMGHKHFPLHPELSRVPEQPDIAWFVCEQPPLIGGETTFCDGVAAANAFSPSLFEHLKSNSLAHTQPVSLEWCANYFGEPDLRVSEIEALSDSKTFEFEMKDGKLMRTFTRPLLHKPLFSNEWAYGNFLVFARRILGARRSPCYADGTEISDGTVDEIEAVTNALGGEIKWQKHDLLMLDNTRVMHGRNPIGDPQTRRIYTQFGYASFAPNEI